MNNTSAESGFRPLFWHTDAERNDTAKADRVRAGKIDFPCSIV